MVTVQAKLEIRVDRDPGPSNGISGMHYRFSQEAGAFPYRFAQRVQRYARAKAPVDTGFLKASIKRETLGPRIHKVTVGAYYGVYVNYGTRYMRAQPFWEPAIQQALRDMRKDMRETLHG